DLPICQC
ncbi:hypothetical protein D039_0093B, partial [Vibrio parahaemolyticus EKP-028]